MRYPTDHCARVVWLALTASLTLLACGSTSTPGSMDASLSTDMTPVRPAPPAPRAVLRCADGACAAIAGVRLAAGDDHTCLDARDDGLSCWGSNARGQLGRSAIGGSSADPAVIPGQGGLVTLSAGGGHTCTTRSDGSVSCWGAGTRGQLGDGARSDRGFPMDVTGFFTQVAAGGEHTCARWMSSGARCWGGNGDGQLGDGTRGDRALPGALMPDAMNFAALAAGASHTCGRTTEGRVVCWGDNAFGQLGDGSTSDRYAPMFPIPDVAGVAAVVAGGRHTCALGTDGSVRCWGDNRSGQLGGGSLTTRSAPMFPIPDLPGVLQIAAGESHTCVVTRDRLVRCWGGNAHGQVGDGTTTDRNVPTAVAGLTDVLMVAIGRRHSCALQMIGQVRCWGDDSLGQLGARSCGTRSSDVECSGRCVDIATDAAHCGSCGNACPTGAVCTGGRCIGACAAGLSTCRGMCRDLQRDPVTCGSCDTMCRPGEFCESGRCVDPCGGSGCIDAPPPEEDASEDVIDDAPTDMTVGPPCGAGETRCGDACVFTQIDNRHCGVCGNACAGGQTCTGGVCTASMMCPFGQIRCGSVCTDVASDSSNCGVCGNACAVGQGCVLGGCMCAIVGQRFCAGSGCVDTASAPFACGECGATCVGAPRASGLCVGGRCGCMSGFFDCDRSRANGCESMSPCP